MAEDRADNIRGSLRAELIRRLAIGDETFDQLAEEFDRAPQTIANFSSRNKAEIRRARQVQSDEYQGLGYAEKWERLAFREQLLRDIEERLKAPDLSDTQRNRYSVTAEKLLHGIAEERGQLPRAEELVANASDEYAGVAIARKYDRIADAEQDLADVNGLLQDPNITHTQRKGYLNLKSKLRREVAEERGELPARTVIEVPDATARHIIEGFSQEEIEQGDRWEDIGHGVRRALEAVAKYGCQLIGPGAGDIHHLCMVCGSYVLLPESVVTPVPTGTTTDHLALGPKRGGPVICHPRNERTSGATCV
jgi:hypothetical protein